jgi:hypothetical protein
MPKPTGRHSNVIGFLIKELILTIIQTESKGFGQFLEKQLLKQVTANLGMNLIFLLNVSTH